MIIAGIDYGSKMAGTTVIAKWDGTSVQLFQSEKKKDADQFVKTTIATQQIETVFLDAPLSLPGVYKGLEGCEDYFYRKGDKELKAMSPMFLGGLTARAMKLCQELEHRNIQVMEVYPGHLARSLNLKDWDYKKQKAALPTFLPHFQTLLPYDIAALTIDNWHQVDALLALFSGLRFLAGKHEQFGLTAEGVILV